MFSLVLLKIAGFVLCEILKQDATLTIVAIGFVPVNEVTGALRLL